MPAIEFLGTARRKPRRWRASPTTAWRRSCAKHPDLFPGLRRLAADEQRAGAASRRWTAPSTQLGAKGIQIFTNVNGRPLDEPEFFPIFERMAKKYDLPIWVHPSRSAKFRRLPDRAEVEVRDLVAVRLALRDQRLHGAHGVLADVREAAEPEDHHPPPGRDGAVTSNRVGYGMDQFGTRTADEDYEGLRKSMKKRPVDYFKMFYGDTSINGSAAASAAAWISSAPTRCCSAPTARSIRRAGRSSSARPFESSMSSRFQKRTERSSLKGMRAACSSFERDCNLKECGGEPQGRLT